MRGWWRLGAGALSLAACQAAAPVSVAPADAAQTAQDAAPATATMANLGWLSGRWVFTDAAGALTEETWTAPADDAMFGVSRTVVSGRTMFFEYLRIEADEGGLVYVASPKGVCPPVRFAASESGAQSIRFDNPTHDDPTSIAYARDGDTLTATIDGPRGPISWTYTRAP
jgi:hypothetical protein